MFGLRIYTHKTYGYNNISELYDETIGAQYIYKWNTIRQGYKRMDSTKMKFFW